MAGSVPRSFVWILTGALLLATFAGLLVAGTWWTFTQSYTVDVTADPGTTWTVSVPRPLASLTIGKSDTVDSVGSWDSPRGAMYNLSGHDDGSAWFTQMSTYFDLNSPGNLEAVSPAFNESGGLLVWVARQTSNASLTVFVSANSFFSFTRVGESLECPGSEYSGTLQEGWNEMTLGLGGCVHLIPAPSLATVSVAFLVAGLVCTYVGVDRGRKFHWQK